MSDFTGGASQGRAYEPIWFALRNGLEKDDYNNDGNYDVNDIRVALSSNEAGYAKGSIISTCFKTENNELDTLIAMVAEVACSEPFHTYRYNNYDDLIPGDNLYAANFQIKRNDAHNYGLRYNNVVNNMGDGTNIGSYENWTILRDYSQAGSSALNVQFMQYIPNQKILQISVADKNNNAYENDSCKIFIDSLFVIPPPVKINNTPKKKIKLEIYPNPVEEIINLSIFATNEIINLSVFDIYGRKIQTITVNEKINRTKIFHLNVKNYKKGIYFIKLETENTYICKKIIIN